MGAERFASLPVWPMFAPKIAPLLPVCAPPVAYGCLVMALRRIGPAKLRPVRRFRAVYNAGMSMYSLWVAAVLCRKLVANGRLATVHALLCVASPGVPWGWQASKIVEWIDTVCIIEAGRLPSSLHLRHHASAASVVALQSLWRTAPTPLFDFASFCNACVHGAMYAFYCAPRTLAPLKRSITVAQIAQHVLVAASIVAALAQPRGSCDAPLRVYGPSLFFFAMWVWDFALLYARTYSLAGKAR